MPGKRVQFDDETLEALEALASRTGKSFQELTGGGFPEGWTAQAERLAGWAKERSGPLSRFPYSGTIELIRVIENQ